MEISKLEKGKELQHQMDHLSEGLDRFDKARERQKSVSLSIGDCDLFGGTSGLKYDIGIEPKDLYNELVSGMRIIINKYYIERRKELAAL